MDGVGQSRIRRAAIHFLSAALVAARCGARFRGPVELRSGCVHRVGPDLRGTIGVCVSTASFAGAGGPLRRGVLRGQSECSADHLHAQRLRRTFGVRIFSAAFSVGIATRWLSGESRWICGPCGGFLLFRVCRGLAVERTCRRHGQLQRGTVVRVDCVQREIMVAAGTRSRWNCTGFRFECILPGTRGVRATLGEYCASTFVGSAANAEFSVLDHQRPGAHLI
jgi:hypothetical protein